jgi:hypothetical protein
VGKLSGRKRGDERKMELKKKNLRHIEIGEIFFKGSVQRKLRWVETGVNRWVLAWDCGAEYCSSV